MRILILSNFAHGLYQFRSELISNLISEGYEVFVSIPKDEFSEMIVSLGASVIDTEFKRRGKNPFKDIALFKKYKTMIKEVQPDVVLTYTIKPNVYGGLACTKTGTPYLSNVTGIGTSIAHGGLLSKLTTTLYRKGLKNSECVFFQNKSNKKLFEEKRVTVGKTKLIPGSGVNLEKHSAEPYPDDDGQTRFLFIGRVMKDKGIEELLGAMKTVSEKHPGVSLDIVGGYDEDYSAQIDEAVKAGYVRYHGQQPDVHEFIKNSHCAVLPSYHEGMANVMLESASTCRPVITTTVPGCRETFDEGVTGFGCEAQSTESLTEALERFIALSYEEKKKMGLAGREKMEREFDREIVIDSYMEEIHRITKK